MAEPPEVFGAAVLAGLPHGFFGRRGGVSLGEIAGLNVGLGAGDADHAVQRNRALAVETLLPGARLATVYQIHSPHCEVVTEPWPDAERPHADAMVTDRPGLLLGVVTADCAPVLFADAEAGVVGAAHAGWKGAVGGVTDATLEAMERLGARRERTVAAVGPCIAQASYEVDAGFAERFAAVSADNDRFFAAGRPGHFQFDLEGYVAARLETAGLRQVERMGLDTYPDDARFYSFRRATHRGEATYGRHISLIGLG